MKPIGYSKRRAGFARRLSMVVALVGAFSGATPAVQAQGAGWEFMLTPYVWLTSINGSVKAPALGKQTVDASFADVLKGTNAIFAAMGHLEARNGGYGGYLDASYMYTKSDERGPGGLVKAEVQTNITFVDLAGFYRLAEGPTGGGAAGSAQEKWAVEAVAGGRYASLNAKIDVGPLGGSKTADWIDPFFGVRASVDLSQTWSLYAHADVGGFGVGSELTANFYGLARYKFDMFGSGLIASFGYRALYFDYENKNNGREYKMWFHGPAAGLTFKL